MPLVLAALAASEPCTAAAGPVTGISDNSPELLDASAFRALNINAVRLVVPWDAADRAGRWDASIARAQAVGADVLVAFDMPRAITVL